MNRTVVLSLFLIVTSLFVYAVANAKPAPAPSVPQVLPHESLTLHLDLPEGSRVDYLRIFYYDVVPANSRAWLTRYDGSGGLQDIATVASSGETGYGTALSSYIGHVVDNLSQSYVLNWKAYQVDNSMRLCGLRLAYRLPESGGWSNFYYIFAAGSTMRPRDSGTSWAYDGGGCVSIVSFDLHLPIVLK